ncbi:hypothetical protein [Xanthobacter flavus]|uniref:hypothetical protein n=1 Tax=Xanthobacter flavus TaxID=281 RepID=UPI001AE2283C|nr:hypothetical protein [Xanthobacter flavus]MBP2147413.1 hypothetical protein [Xanthobacter flavus]
MTRAEKLIAAARIARARKGYERSLAHDLEREHARAMMYGAQDWDAGRDTEWARAFVALRTKVEGAETTKRKASDPLNLTGHTRPTKPSKVERKARAKARPKQETVLDGDGLLRKVEVKGVSLRGLEVQQQRAAQDFARDWESAYRSLRCRGFEPTVSGGGHGSREHLARVEAQDRLRFVEARLGRRDWTVLVSVVIGGAGPHELTSRGAPQHRVVSAEIKRVLNIVAGFYRPGTRHRDPLLDACNSVIEEMQRKAG